MLMEKKITIAIVAGIRSQFIKLCSFQRMFNSIDVSVKSSFNFIYVDAGQHYSRDLAQGFIEDLGIKFDYTLRHNVKIPINILGSMIVGLYELFIDIHNHNGLDYVIVFGDANATLAGAIAASKAHIKLIHVESGLRVGDKSSPEEGNRIVADHLATIRFVSNKPDFNNITKEGLADFTFFSGDIIYDLVLDIKKHGFSQINIEENQCSRTYERENFVIASMHREENLREGILARLFKVLGEIDHDVLFIAHPRENNEIRDLKYDRNKITVSNHINYSDMLSAISKCKYILTDSGAIQREAYYLEKRCLIRQDRAFWQSLVDLNAHRLIGKTSYEMFEGVEWVEKAIRDTTTYPKTDDLGCGNAVETILRKIIEVGVCDNDVE